MKDPVALEVATSKLLKELPRISFGTASESQMSV